MTDMLAVALKLHADSPMGLLKKVSSDLEDVNYHRENSHLTDAIDAIEAGDRVEAKIAMNRFRKEIKKTIADYSDEYFDVNEGREGQFDVETTERIAQKVADAFTAEDSNDLDLKYVVSPGVEASHFDLDVEAGPNTPGEDWKDENGFGISNYLGKYAGGSFLIKNGIVINAAMRSAPVAKVSPEGEIEMISAEESRAAIGMEENKEETKSNKMKKSELKEMIKAAMLAEIEVSEDVDKIPAEKLFALIARDLEFSPLAQDNVMLSKEDAIEIMRHVIAIEQSDISPEAALGEYIASGEFEEAGDIPGFEGTKDALDKLGLEEDQIDAAAVQSDENEVTDQIGEADEEEEVEVDADVEVDAEAGAEEGGEEVDVEASEEEEIDVKEKAKVDPNVKAVQDALTIAQAAAAELGDVKLTDQIGNTITFFTRAHVASVDKEAMAEEMKVNEVAFPMWTKINK